MRPRLLEFREHENDAKPQVGILHGFSSWEEITYAIVETERGDLVEIHLSGVRFVDTIMPTDGTVWKRQTPTVTLTEYQALKAVAGLARQYLEATRRDERDIDEQTYERQKYLSLALQSLDQMGGRS